MEILFNYSNWNRIVINKINKLFILFNLIYLNKFDIKI